MSDSFPIKIKHSGKTYDLNLNLNEVGLNFKLKVKELINIDVEKVKIVVKGGMLKDETKLSSLGLKEVSSYEFITVLEWCHIVIYSFNADDLYFSSSFSIIY